MTTNEILTQLNGPAEAIPSLEQQYTYADDSGHRRPHPLAEDFFESLPPSVTDVLSHYAGAPMRTQQLLALLSLMGSVAIHCRVNHDNRWYGTALMVLVYGSPASGKGRITELLPIVQGIDTRVREESRKERRQAERMRRAQQIKQSRLGKNRDITDNDIDRAVMAEEEVEIPLPRCHMIADNITVPAMLQYLKGSEPRTVLLTATELLTIVQQSRTDYGNMRDLLLRAFHEERMSYAIRSNNNESLYLEHVRMGVLLSGTYDSLRQFMPTVSDGLPSRFLFYETPADTDWHTPMNRQRSQAFRKSLISMAGILESLYGTLARYDDTHDNALRPTLTLTDSQEEYLDRAFSEMNDWYYGYTGSEQILSAVRRRIIDAKRIILLLSLLRLYHRHGAWGEVFATPHIVADDDDIDTTLTLVRHLMYHSISAFAFIEPSHAQSELPESPTAASFLDLLPPTFTTAEAVAIGKQVGVSERTAKRYLRALDKGLFINRLEKGHYQRCNKNI